VTVRDDTERDTHKGERQRDTERDIQREKGRGERGEDGDRSYNNKASRVVIK
jgi:hypothetical protein